jgi:hypothetical protein
MELVAWGFLVLAILANTVVSILIQVRVNEKLPRSERFSWWTRQGFDVGRKHRQLFPESVLPDLQIALFAGTLVWGWRWFSLR